MPKSKAIIRKELLTYLSRFPSDLQRGRACPGELALQIGNCLVWLSGEIDEAGHHSEQPIGETPQTVTALGKQFQQAGRHLLDSQAEKPHELPCEEIERAKSRIAHLESQIVDLIEIVRESKASGKEVGQ
jgi:hypothetical protein